MGKGASLMTGQITILGIESSCDDTAAAVVCDQKCPDRIRANVILSQHSLHADYGGVVPEIAARAHAEKLDFAVEAAMKEAGATWSDLDAVAVTAGPGLIGGLLSGVMLAKGITTARRLPLLGINHLAGHALTPRLTNDLVYPYLMLLISGGHCQFLIVHGPDQFDRLGGTIDDAPGEAFDKSARALGLGQPGGPAIESAAKTGDRDAVALPRPLLDRPDCNMSFSGLKTALIREIERNVSSTGTLKVKVQADIAAAFQAAVADILAQKTSRALKTYLAQNPRVPTIAVAGGVAANSTIRSALDKVAQDADAAFVAPPLALCTDNAAMIAWAGIELFRTGYRSDMSLSARPRWPLDPTKSGMLGSGKKGAKA